MFTKFNRILCIASLLAVSISAEGRGMDYFSKVDFYGQAIQFKYDSDILYTFDDKNNQLDKAISDFIVKTKTSNVCDIIVHIDDYATQYQLDDIGYVQLTKAIIRQVYKGKSVNFQQVLLWRLLDEKGFDVVLGYHNNVISTYGLTDEVVFGTPFVKMDNNRYYDLSFKEDKNRSFTKIYKGHERREEKRRKIKISCFSSPKFTTRVNHKTFNFNYGNGTYSIQGSINQSLTEYLKDLPIISIGKIYVNSGFSAQARETVVHQLAEIASNKPTFEQLNILLKFVQQAIPYKSDQEYLGQEDYSFPEETLRNEFSDCEDKSMLFATLVKEILHIDAVAIYYKELEHVNIALKMPSVKTNYSFMYKGQPYVICEPSSTGLRMGQTHQEYVDALSADKIIPLY